MSDPAGRPTHLDPSELGTKEYWDKHYQNDLDQGDEDEDAELVNPEDLESWFDDVDAPTKILEYLTSETFPLSPNNHDNKMMSRPFVLDLGCGNGSMLFRLRTEGGYTGVMTGIDYSQQSIDLACKLHDQYLQLGEDGAENLLPIGWATMRFETMDLIREDPIEAPWWRRHGFGYDLVMDKGTFDAISLSSETVTDEDGTERRICELYPRKVVKLVGVGGFLLITSCNWTEEEILKWFLHNDDIKGQLELFGKIDYPVYEFGGKQGSGVVSLCFRRVGQRIM